MAGCSSRDDTLRHGDVLPDPVTPSSVYGKTDDATYQSFIAL